MKTALKDFGGKIGGARKDLASPTMGGPGPRTRRPARASRYTVYVNQTDGKIFAAMATASSRVVALEYFATVESAAAWLAATPAGELARLHRAAFAKNTVTDEHCRRPINRTRSGPDHRQGLPVDPDVFMRSFGVFGVEFGNWQNNRQEVLDQAYDALHDLAGAVGVSPAVLGFGGTLGLAFGARGHGGAAAHYEPLKNAINLTKTAGAGCLAHEWFHAFEFKSGIDLRELTTTLKKLGMYTRAKLADRYRSKKYWSTAPEMHARAFESWVSARVNNDYLANIRTPDEFEKSADRYPYPIASEMLAIDAAFRRLFLILPSVQTQETATIAAK